MSFSLIALLLISFLGSAMPAVAGLAVEHPCDAEESWQAISGLKPKVAEFFRKGPPQDEAAALARFREAYLAQGDRTLDSISKMGAQYWMWRSLFSLKLELLAQPAFLRLLAKADSPALRAIRYAAIACVTRTAEKYPVLQIPRAEQEMILKFPLEALTESQRSAMLKARFAIIKDRIARGESAEASGLDALKSSENLHLFAQGLLTLGTSPRDAAVSLEKFLKAENPQWLIHHEEFVHLTLGRVYYELGNYEQSLRHFDAVNSHAPWFAQAVSERAWSQLMKKDYSKALGTAYTAETTALRKAFLPTTALVAGIAYFETCNYSESVQATQFLQGRYSEAYDWLSKNSAKPLQDYYGAALESVKGKGKVPLLIASAWINSNAFSAAQEQINRLLQEGETALGLRKRLSKDSRNPASSYLSKLLAFHTKELARTETLLIGRINQKLSVQSAVMLSQLEDIADRGQLLEAEVFTAATGKVLGSRALASVSAGGGVQKARAAAKKLESQPVWVWGRVSADKVAQSESWQDEVGLFRADLTDRCAEK